MFNRRIGRSFGQCQRDVRFAEPSARLADEGRFPSPFQMPFSIRRFTAVGCSACGDSKGGDFSAGNGFRSNVTVVEDRPGPDISVQLRQRKPDWYSRLVISRERGITGQDTGAEKKESAIDLRVYHTALSRLHTRELSDFRIP